MITDIQKCKNDNLFSDEVLVFLIFSNGRECEEGDDVPVQDRGRTGSERGIFTSQKDRAKFSSENRLDRGKC